MFIIRKLTINGWLYFDRNGDWTEWKASARTYNWETTAQYAAEINGGEAVLLEWK